jgi:AcrR family transcriptional regulator
LNPKSNSKPLKKSQLTRKLILDVAAALFSSRGYNATPLREVAAAANMKAGSLYYHFDSKESMMLEILNMGIEGIAESVNGEIARLPEGAEFGKRLEAAMLGHLKAILVNGDYASTNIRNYGQVPERVRAASMPVREQYEDIWRTLLKRGQEEGAISSKANIGLLRLTIFGGMNWASEWYRPEGLTIEVIAAEQAKLFLKGIAA